MHGNGAVAIDTNRFQKHFEAYFEIGCTDDDGLHRLALSDADLTTRDRFVADLADSVRSGIMIDTDCANVLRTAPFALKRAIFELYRYGIDEAAIRKFVLENPRDVFGLGS